MLLTLPTPGLLLPSTCTSSIVDSREGFSQVRSLGKLAWESGVEHRFMRCSFYFMQEQMSLMNRQYFWWGLWAWVCELAYSLSIITKIITRVALKCITSRKFRFQTWHLNLLQRMLQYFSQERTVEDSSYNTEDFLFRWKKLERVVTKQGADGLLIATGLDARDNVHSAYLFNWLFLGLSGRAITINKYLDPVYSEIIVIVSAKGSQIFVTPEAYENLEGLICSIPNCTVFCPTEKQYSNKQVLDTLKIASFFTMTQKITKMALFLGDNEDVKIIQKWPIIQSYALEPVGRTFFTLKHQAVNLGSKISALFRNLDKYSLTSLVSRTAYSLEGHIKGALTSIELRSQQQRAHITEASLQQTLQQAVDIGLFESGNEEYKQLVRVLFGARTQTAQPSSDTVSISSQRAQHFTVEHFDPYTRMKVWRSYFLNVHTKNIQSVSLSQRQESESFIVKNIYHLTESENPSYARQNTLVSLYVSLVQGTLEAITSVAKDYRNLNSDYICKFVLGKIGHTAKQLYGSEFYTPNDILCEIESFDSFGEPRPIDFKDSISFKLTSTFYVVKLRLKNVKCYKSGEKLGSLIFSESFLIQQGCYLLLTKRCPYFDFWCCEAPSCSLLAQLNPNYSFDELGKALSAQGYKNRLFIPSEKLSAFHFSIPVLSVRYYFHEKGLRIFNQKIGWQILLYSEVQDMTMVNRIPGEWVLMKTRRNFIFDSLQNNVLAVEFRGKPFQFLMKQTKSKEHPIELTFIEEIPPLLLENWHFASQILRKPVRDGAVIHQHQILANQFLWSFIESKQLMIINQMKDIKMAAYKSIHQCRVEKRKQSVPAPEGKHSIIVINGSYGSGKYNLARALKRFGPQEVVLDIFRVSSDNLYKKIPNDAYIDMLEEYIRENEVPRTTCLVVIVPSWLNCAEMLPTLAQKFHIRSVLTKVNASNFYATRNKQLTENILTFCLPGYSQNIVIDSFAEEESLINTILRVVGATNREANVFRSTNCLLTTGQCADIVLNNSYNGEYQTFLRNKYGAFYVFEQLAGLEINYIEFKYPIHDVEGIKNLKKSQGYLLDRAAVVRELQHRKKQAQNSKDQLMMGLYLLEEVMTKVPHIRSVKAVVLYQPEQDKPGSIYELNSSNSDFKFEEAKDQSRPLGFFIMSRRYSELEVRNLIESLSYKKVLFGEVQQMRSVDSLSEADIASIQKWAIENQKYLGEGYYFDGYVLRNGDGFLVERHPNLQRAIEGYINEENTRISAHNSELRSRWNEYISEYRK